MTGIDGSSNVLPSNLPEHEAGVVRADKACTFKSHEDPVQVEQEKELEQLRQTTSEYRKTNEILQQFYDTLKEFMDKVSLLSRERESRDKRTESVKEEMIVLLKQKVSYLNNLNTSLKSQLENRNKEFMVMESTYKTRKGQDQSKIVAPQSELTKISENREKERKKLSGQIQDVQSKSAEKTSKPYQLTDPRAAGFDVGKKVKSIHGFKEWTGTVTAVDSSGYVDVKWDNGGSDRYRAGAGGVYHVELL